MVSSEYPFWIGCSSKYSLKFKLCIYRKLFQQNTTNHFGKIPQIISFYIPFRIPVSFLIYFWYSILSDNEKFPSANELIAPAIFSGSSIYKDFSLYIVIITLFFIQNQRPNIIKTYDIWKEKADDLWIFSLLIDFKPLHSIVWLFRFRQYHLSI